MKNIMRVPRYKGMVNKGNVLVIGGSPSCYGPPILTALSAEASGAHSLHLYTCPRHLEVAKNNSLNFLLHSFPENPGYLSLYDVKKIQEIEADAISIGNGMGQDFDAKKAMLAIVNSDKPIVIDCHGLVPELLKIYNPHKHKWVLTPNHREFTRLFKVDVTEENVEAVAKRYRLNLCVKGKTDYIIACNDFKLDSSGLLENSMEIDREMLLHRNNSGSDQMRVSGTGDALAGIILSYIGQGFSALQSMVVATNLFGLAAEALAKETYSFSAKSLIEFYPKFIVKNG